MKTILAPIDFSTGTREVVAAAASLARDLRARLVLLHVIEPLPPAASEFGFAEAGARLAGTAEEHAVKLLTDVQRQLHVAGITASTFHVVGVPGHAILEQARGFEANFIVLGSHGHGALYELIVGSTANRVLKEAKCPVLIVPRNADRNQLTDALTLDAVEAVTASSLE